MRFAAGFGTDPLFSAALAVLKARGATLIEIRKFDDKAIGGNEFTVLLTELKAGLNAYLAESPAPIAVRTLADVIAFNKRNMAVELPLFGQDTFEKAEVSKGLADAGYKKARQASFQAAANAIDGLLKRHKLDALVGPTMPPAWKIDAVNGDQISGGGAASLAAVAGFLDLELQCFQDMAGDLADHLAVVDD